MLAGSLVVRCAKNTAVEEALRYTAAARRTVWQKVSRVSNFSEYQQHLDASGLACPMPLLKTKLALRDLAAGEVLLVNGDRQWFVAGYPVNT